MRFLERNELAVVPGKAFEVGGCMGKACTQSLEILREVEKRVRVFINRKDVKKSKEKGTEIVLCPFFFWLF